MCRGITGFGSLNLYLFISLFFLMRLWKLVYLCTVFFWGVLKKWKQQVRADRKCLQNKGVKWWTRQMWRRRSQTDHQGCRFSGGILQVCFLAPIKTPVEFNYFSSHSTWSLTFQFWTLREVSPSPSMAVLYQRGNWTLRAGTFPAVDLIKYVPP